jgi:putative SOS response-associated peptidase YedK
MPFRRHRCLLPANGFYEWRTLAAGAGEAQRKQPLHIGMADGSLFGLAGLYERWRGDDDRVLDTCTIVTTEANALVQPIHDRMPLIVEPEHYASWLDPANADVVDLIAPYPPPRWRLPDFGAGQQRSPRRRVAARRVDPIAGESARTRAATAPARAGIAV